MAVPLSLENPMLPIWHAMLDGRYLVEVQRIDSDYGNFVIFDVQDNHKELFSKRVPLMYGAAFGPDVENVAEWQEMGVQFVDGLDPINSEPLTVENLLPEYEENFARLHQLLHKVGGSPPEFADPLKLLTLIDSIKMTCQKLEEI